MRQNEQYDAKFGKAQIGKVLRLQSTKVEVKIANRCKIFNLIDR